jgi:hypothetical protein
MSLGTLQTSRVIIYSPLERAQNDAIGVTEYLDRLRKEKFEGDERLRLLKCSERNN